MAAPKDQEARKLWIERNRAAHMGMGAKEKVPCPVEGCDRHVQAQGLCLVHYRRLERHGSVEATQAVNKGAKCCVDDCERDSFSKGMCRLHYQRKYKTGSTDCEFPRAKGLPGRPQTEEAKRKLSASTKGKPAPNRRGPRNGRWGKLPVHGKTFEYGGNTFRSTYEVRFAKLMDRLETKWEYEPKRFDLGDRTYTPDFYLPETEVYWELKGWLDPNSQRRHELFRERYPEETLVVATLPVLKMYECSIGLTVTS